MRLFEFTDANEQLALWKLISDSVWAAIASQADTERIAKQRQSVSTKKSTQRKSVKKSKSAAAPKPKKLPKKQQVTTKSAQPPKQQKSPSQTQKPQPLPNVFSSTARSNLEAPQTQIDSAASLAAQTRSKRLQHDPNSVANIQRQLYPLANSGVVKRLTS